MSSWDRGAYPQVRPRRLRIDSPTRELVAETRLSPSDLILPLFVHQRQDDEPIRSMPGQFRRSVDSVIKVAHQAVELGIPAIALFPRIDDAEKSITGDAAWDATGLVPQLIRRLKQEVPRLLVVADVALDPYSSLGQDGVVIDGRIDNDRTIEALVRQALCQAAAGADIVAPSDMMDGRIGAIRAGLDANGHIDTRILAYSAKYASSFYGPFRDALDSAPRGGTDKKTYQMDPRNSDEALHEVALDLSEGADIIMIKPGLAYLDIVYRVKQAFRRPTAVYHVSGEYAMLKAAAANGWIDERAVALETLIAFKRAGADMILTYLAMEAAGWLRESG